MSFVFEPEKVTQAAAILLEHADGRKMNYLKFIKLLYIADRESLQEIGTPITGDWFVAMKHGPVLSYTLSLIKGEMGDEEGEEYWYAHIEKRGYNIVLKEDPGVGELSRYEMNKLEEVFKRYQDFDWQKMTDLTHGFPEWVKNNPGAGMRPIPIEDILVAVGRAGDIEKVRLEREEEKYFTALFGGEVL